jgi:hypothetical protein
MKDMEQIEELLNSYIDDELDERKSNEVKRLIDNDKEIQSLYDSLKRYKSLMQTVSRLPVPEGLCENITAQLERHILLADTDIYSHKAGRRHLMARRLITVAAIIVLAAILSVIVFDIFVPKSSREQLMTNVLRKRATKQVLYERPFDETKQPQEDKQIVPETTVDAPLVAILTLETDKLIEVDWLVAKALTTTNLFNQTAAIDRQPGSVRYVLNCNKDSLVSLMQELSFIWPQCTNTKMDIGTEQAGKYITINNISTQQMLEICKAESFGQRLRMANDLAVINKVTSPAVIDRLYAAADIDYDLLKPQKPVLTSIEKTQTVNQLLDNTKNVTLTIIVISK